jgi:hypothetical protein
MAGEYTDTTARIVRILVDCGMIAHEELEIVRGLIQGAAVTKDGAGPGEEGGNPGVRRSLPAIKR